MSTGLTIGDRIKLIDFDQVRSHLYNLSDATYKGVVKKRNAWEFIGSEFEKSGTAVQDAWKHIRKQYSAYRRNLKQKTDSGTKKIVTFRHSALMEFFSTHFRPYIRISESQNSTNLNEGSDDQLKQIKDYNLESKTVVANLFDESEFGDFGINNPNGESCEIQTPTALHKSVP